MARKFAWSAPQGRGERRAQHAFRKANAHTHSVASKRKPGQVATVRCTRLDCRKFEVA